MPKRYLGGRNDRTGQLFACRVTLREEGVWEAAPFPVALTGREVMLCTFATAGPLMLHGAAVGPGTACLGPVGRGRGSGQLSPAWDRETCRKVSGRQKEL